MENSLKLQMDVKNNAQELRSYMLDLNNWEEEMKKKEMALNNEKPTTQNAIPPPRNKIKRSKSDNEKNNSKAKKISAYDYSAWDKFDVEKACAEIDKEKEDEGEREEEVNENNHKPAEEITNHDLSENFSLVDEAFYEKEMGNNFVRKGKWGDAIKCYTNAINLDPSNAIFYANRSLCFLKLKNFKSAETDATTAIQLDKNYVKAYQRRAMARLALQQLVEAKSDYQQILSLEPGNALARTGINNIDEKLNKEQTPVKSAKQKTFNHKNIFKSEDTKPANTVAAVKKKTPTPKANSDSHKSQTTPPKPSEKDEKIETKTKPEQVEKSEKEKNEESEKPQLFEKGDGDKKVPVQPTQVFKPLPDWCKIVHPIEIPPHKRSKQPLRRIEISVTDKDEGIDFAGDAKAESSIPCERIEEIKVLRKFDRDDELRREKLSFDVPKTAIQFQNCWKALKRNPEECYRYLKKIPGCELVHIFENSLESDFFSQLITFLANEEMEKEPELVYDFLLGLTKVKRFSSLILFMSESDRTCVKKCIRQLEKVHSKEQISELITLYEL